MPPKKKPATTPHYNVGNRVTVTLYSGQLVDATIRAIIDGAKGRRYQVDYGKDLTALVHPWQLRLAHANSIR